MTLPIAYSDLVSLFLFIFALVGLMRGWYKEGITFLFAASLALLVWRPEAASMLIGRITDVMKALVMFIRAGFNPESQALAEPGADTGTLLDPNSYKIYVVITVALLAVSYIVGEVTFKQKMTALGVRPLSARVTCCVPVPEAGLVKVPTSTLMGRLSQR